MTVSLKSNAFVSNGPQTIGMSQIFGVTDDGNNPAYVIVSGVDRNEYTAGETILPGSFSGDGATDPIKLLAGDYYTAGIIFTYNSATGQYVNSTYGNLLDLTYTSSASPNDMTAISAFGTDNLPLADFYAAEPSMMAEWPAYFTNLGTATVVTSPTFAGPAPAQATPDSVTSAAMSFVGQAWNDDGCWVLANSIATEAGAALPVVTDDPMAQGVPNGEWHVAYNGPVAANPDWAASLTAGEVIVLMTSPTTGHVTTVASGSGASAELVDNWGPPANDGSNSDIIISGPHLASAEFGYTSDSDVVVYELDTPAETASAAAATLQTGSDEALSSLFSAADPFGTTITEYQAYDSLPGDGIMVNGMDDTAAQSAASACTFTSLASASLATGTQGGMDTVEVRAFNGSYWGDWTPVTVDVAAPPAPSPIETAWEPNHRVYGGHAFSFTLPANLFTDPQGQPITYSAATMHGGPLPPWMSFDPATGTFSGIAPKVASGAMMLGITVTATDASGNSGSQTFAFTRAPAGAAEYARVPAAQALNRNPAAATGAITPQTLGLAGPGTASVSPGAVAFVNSSPPVIAAATLNQHAADGQAFSLDLAGAFSDPQGSPLALSAVEIGGPDVTSWLTLSPQDMLGGLMPAAGSGTAILRVTASDGAGAATSETFGLSWSPSGMHVAAGTFSSAASGTELYALHA